MMILPINLAWSHGCGDSDDCNFKLEVSDELFKALLDLYNSKDGIPFDQDVEDYYLEDKSLNNELLNCRNIVLKEYKDIERINWDEFLKDRYSEYKDFEDYYNNYFMLDVFKCVRVDPWTNLNELFVLELLNIENLPYKKEELIKLSIILSSIDLEKDITSDEIYNYYTQGCSDLLKKINNKIKLMN